MKRKAPVPTPDLKIENVRLKAQVRELTKLVTKSQRQIGKHLATQLADKALIKALVKEKRPPEPKPLSDVEAARRIAFTLNMGGYDLVDGKAVQVGPPRKSS